MISTKIYESLNGTSTRFLSDFIILSEAHVRVYVSSTLVPAVEDLVNVDEYDLVDNAILFYEAPTAGSNLFIEVATTPEEFGEVLLPPIMQQTIEVYEDTVGVYEDTVGVYEDTVGVYEDTVVVYNNTVTVYNDAVTATGVAVDKAHKWADEAEDVEVEPGEYSAFHWAMKSMKQTEVMFESIYDPQNISADVFDVDNHVSGVVNTLYTHTDKALVDNSVQQGYSEW